MCQCNYCSSTLENLQIKAHEMDIIKNLKLQTTRVEGIKTYVLSKVYFVQWCGVLLEQEGATLLKLFPQS